MLALKILRGVYPPVPAGYSPVRYHSTQLNDVIMVQLLRDTGSLTPCMLSSGHSRARVVAAGAEPERSAVGQSSASATAAAIAHQTLPIRIIAAGGIQVYLCTHADSCPYAIH